MSDDPAHNSPLLDAGPLKLSEQELEKLAWRFLRSEFTGQIYADWPIDRRIDAYLKRHGMHHVVNNGDAYNAVLQHILANVGPALRNGVLATTTCCANRLETRTAAKSSIA